MGATVHAGTMDGGMTPICNACGIMLCWDIGESEYEADKPFWDGWQCADCNGGRAMSLKAWRSQIGAKTCRKSDERA